MFWQTIYERSCERLREKGVRIREPQDVEISLERMKVAHEIKAIRIKLGYTQKELAKKLKVIQQYISKIENGHENVSVGTLKRIAAVFGKVVEINFIDA